MGGGGSRTRPQTELGRYRLAKHVGQYPLSPIVYLHKMFGEDEQQLKNLIEYQQF